MKKTLRVVIIDDSSFNRETIASILNDEPDIEVVGTADDGEQGLKVVAEKKPDLITLDVEMPRMDGFTFLRLLMSKMPTPVIMISSHSRKQEVFQALELGALDFVAKPTRYLPSDTRVMKEEILRKVRTVRHLRVMPSSERSYVADTHTAHSETDDSPAEVPAARVVCVGASTGGPPALQTLFRSGGCGGRDGVCGRPTYAREVHEGLRRAPRPIVAAVDCRGD